MKQVLTIAGSDSGGGAGIQADLKAFHANGAFGMSVITSITAQNSREVRQAFDLPTDLIVAQINAIFDDFEVAAVKNRHALLQRHSPGRLRTTRQTPGRPTWSSIR